MMTHLLFGRPIWKWWKIYYSLSEQLEKGIGHSTYRSVLSFRACLRMTELITRGIFPFIWFEMNNLPITHPLVHLAFEKGHFSVQMQKNTASPKLLAI